MKQMSLQGSQLPDNPLVVIFHPQGVDKARVNTRSGKEALLYFLHTHTSISTWHHSTPLTAFYHVTPVYISNHALYTKTYY